MNIKVSDMKLNMSDTICQTPDSVEEAKEPTLISSCAVERLKNINALNVEGHVGRS